MISPASETLWYNVDTAGDTRVRRAAMALAERLGFGASRVGEVGIVAAELTSNLARHGGGGTIALRRPGAAAHQAVGLLALDQGPGMDVAVSLRDGQSTSSSLGIGLGAVGRLATLVDVYSVPGRGTVIDAVLYADGAAAEEALPAGLARPMTNEQVCGDAFVAICEQSRQLLVLVDGLGHGPLAATAAQVVIQAVLEDPGRPPVALIAEMHRRARPTRGAAAAVAEVDLAGRVVRFTGVGNVAGWIVHDDRRQGMASQPGIVGGSSPRAVREAVFELTAGAVVVLHSDGLTDKWQLSTYPGVRGRSATVIAGVLLRDAGVRHDDASVLVSKAVA